MIMNRFVNGFSDFCVGVKHATIDFCDWYINHSRVPRIFRNRTTLVLTVAAVTAGGFGLSGVLFGADSADFVMPVAQGSSDHIVEKISVTGDTFSVVRTAAATTSSSSSSASSSSSSSATPKKKVLTGDELTSELKKRQETYYKDAAASGVTYAPPPAGDIAAWKKKNPDTIGWITISNTNVNYAVLQGPYTDYYTHKGYSKEYSKNGVIWIASEAKLASNGALASQNTVVFGHNWTNCWRPVRIGNPADVMFGQVAAYDDAAFAKANPYIRLATADGDHTYQIFSVFYARPSQFVYWTADGPEVPGIISKAKSMSIHDFGVAVKSTDKVITLSTCTRIMGAGDDQRLVVMAKKIS